MTNQPNYHLIDQVRRRAEQFASKTALRYKSQQIWQDISWQSFQQSVDLFSLALLAHGIEVQQKIAIFAHNMPQWTITDFGALQIRAVTVPIYATNTAKQAEFILNHADIRILFVGDHEQLEAALEVADNCPLLEKIVCMKSQEISLIRPLAHTKVENWNDFIAYASQDKQTELNQRLADKNLSDLFTLIYTSGTTGEPKGVMLDYANIAHQLHAHDLALPKIDENDVSLSFLPFSHIFERAWVAYVLYRGATVCYLEDTNEVRNALNEVKPTLMCAVPRLYEKMYSAIWDKVNKAPIHRRALFKWAISVGKKKRKNTLSYKLADKLVLNKLRALLGGRIRMMPCGGAKLEPTIGQFFQAIGVNIKLGYGMTETTATVSCWADEQFEPNSIGRLMPNAEVKIGENNEILVRGGMVMRGYYKRPEETALAFTEDGFLKTGDAGEFDAQSNLYITDRIKELMKTSNGKYIAPQYIEGKIGKDKFIEQIAIIADAKKYVSALIVPCFESLEEYAKQLNIKYQDRMELVKHSEIVQLFEKRINELQKELAHFEQIKKFTLLPQAFSVKMEEITPTLKLRRKVILERYRKQIESMYK
ncbi:AMP-dependent synthetase/ligase [Actinobacillus pleuropneumoniae]|uniref:AMP-dependent synthetase/ligase n=1 Tax=Actinobacillus pleuropneumoniae TaxID=715 RepID=UPI001F37CE20|nr:long-chain fatty acid--CoA ligase [Actinobacillus pleuropneumoniae]UKH18995.1 long-chain fatty acid--CoA ligase [Actinobacillus pleuropneumoniae]UKH23111.1 long-chain fatty acid--CoA ligase [Actinobacillus pleuropneumoniae]USQ16063.1 long-chain fatty acid--CoA ligase [Actinobacillus pleuropneumoniae]